MRKHWGKDAQGVRGKPPSGLRSRMATLDGPRAENQLPPLPQKERAMTTLDTRTDAIQSMRHNFTKVLILVQNYYGMGSTVDEAKAEIKKIRGKALKAKETQAWWIVSEDTTVDGIDGSLRYPKTGSKPFLINKVPAE